MHKNSFFNKLNLNINKQNNRGITLIALVITIVVLLILAGVSIAMLTGENGILTQAQNAKTATESSAEQEKIKIAVSGSRNNDGILSFEKLKEEIENQAGKVFGDSIPTTVEINNTLYRIDENGNVTKPILGGSLSSVTGVETTNTTVQDSLGNQVVVPAGFKIVNTNDYVTDGIIIEDVSHEATKGSQFVWIPVGDIIKEDKTTENITLSRYDFDENGKNLNLNDDYIHWYKELNVSTYGNATAKENIEDENSGFRKSVKDNKGYYIGRFEARDNNATSARTPESNKDNQVVCIANKYIYNCITQPQAAQLSRSMYSDNSFENDLCNSYAWDTAIVFLQKFDNRLIKTKPYSIQNSLYASTDPAIYGTYNLSQTQKDVICNLYDMASNCFEWSTETAPDYNAPNTLRGGRYYYPSEITSRRNCAIPDKLFRDSCFRPILYIKN